MKKAFHAAKQCAHCLAGRGWQLNGVYFDTLVASYLVRPGQRATSFDDVVRRHTGAELAPPEDGQLSLLEVADENDQFRENLARRAAYLLALVAQLSEELDGYGETRLFHEMEMPLVMVLQRMEHDGIAVSSRALHELEDDFSAQAALLEREAYAAIGDDTVNLGSPKQLQAVLFLSLIHI